MDLQSNLIESSKHKRGPGFKYSAASLGLHGLIIAFIVFMTASATHKVTAEDHPIRVFMSQAAAPPPPPPPPPPAASNAAPHPTQVVKPVQIPQTSFVQPREIPKEIPKVPDLPTTTAAVDTTPSTAQPAGEPGAVPGGVAGGVQGGVVGGVVGGQVGGVLGGTPGGTGTEPAPEPPPPPPPPKPEGPLRVGGDVKAPVVIKRAEPQYTEVARKARLQGTVIVEAIIDRDGNVDHVKVLRGMGMGLSEQAEAAVKLWKFRPGTMAGQPVDVIFNLVVNFTLDGSGPKLKAPAETTSTE